MAHTKTLSTGQVILLAISSMLGAGIFLKTKTLNVLSHNNSWAIIFILLLGIVLVIALLLSLSLIVSQQKGEMGVLEWTQKYCSQKFNKASIQYFRFIYQPLSLILISIFVIELLKQKYELSLGSTIVGAFLCLFFWMLVNLISFRLASFFQMILLFIVLMALVFLPIIGFMDLYNGTVALESVDMEPATSLDSLGPWMILISGLPSIFFMYDGFYSTLSLRDKLAKPQHLTKILTISFIAITAIYACVIISFKLVSSTGHFADIPTIKNNPIIYDFFNLSVISAALLTLNSTSMSGIRMLESAHKEYRFNDVNWLKRKLFFKKKIKDEETTSRVTIWIYLLLKTVVWFLIIAIFSSIVNLCNGKSDNIFSINEAIADVTSSFVFLIIAAVIINLKKLIKEKYPMKDMSVYKYASITTAAIIYAACGYIYLNFFVGMFGYAGADPFLSTFQLLIALLFLAISIFPIIKNKFCGSKKKYRFKLFFIDKHKTNNSIICLI